MPTTKGVCLSRTHTSTRGASGVALALLELPRVRLGRDCDVWRPAVLSGLCSSLVAGGFARLPSALLFAVRCLFAASAADCRASCALFRALCESVLLSCSESVLLSCSNSPSWPSRSRCLVSVGPQSPCQPCCADMPRLCCSTHMSTWRTFDATHVSHISIHDQLGSNTHTSISIAASRLQRTHPLGVCAAVLLELTELAEPVEMRRLCC